MKIAVRVKRGEGPIEEREGFIIVYSGEKRENNKANLDVTRQIARFYSVPSTSVRIIAGSGSTRKMVEIKKD
jgi:uncharacterized protein YggU (UPF0235/DUF167 family)